MSDELSIVPEWLKALRPGITREVQRKWPEFDVDEVLAEVLRLGRREDPEDLQAHVTRNLRVLLRVAFRVLRRRVPESPARRLRRAIARVLRRLPARSRRILLLVHADGLTWNEIAQKLGCSAEAVRKAYCRALSRLRDVDFDEGPEGAMSMAKLPPKPPSPLGHHAHPEIEGDDGAAERRIRGLLERRRTTEDSDRASRRRLG